jgi:Sugar-specific transcriptional regulator TrmB
VYKQTTIERHKRFDKLFTMLNNKKDLHGQLCVLGLSCDEATIYLELLKGPTTHLKLAQATGINRTKIYRLADELENRSLVTKRVDDRGMALVATDPSTLEVELVTQREVLARKYAVFQSLLPQLENIRTRSAGFTVHTYVGEKGFKQMLWHELNAREELLSMGDTLLEKMVHSRRWTEQYRNKVLAAGFHIRALVNRDSPYRDFTQNKMYLSRYSCRCIPQNILILNHAMDIYNDTVAVLRWNDDHKVGIEIIDASHAQAMRQIFESYWNIAAE